MENKLTKEQIEMYKRNNPNTWKEDILMYEMRKVKGKSVISILHEIQYSEAAIYRRIKKVEEFLTKQQFYNDFSTLEYLHPRGVILMGYDKRIICLITQVAIALKYQHNINYIDKYYYNVLLEDTPSIRNRKKELEEELKKVYWENVITNERTLIFNSIKIDRNSIQFTLTEEMNVQIAIMHFMKKIGRYD